MSKLEDAQHEAAHVVVGKALGLRLIRATLAAEDPADAGYAHFGDGAREALMLMYAAGIAWERRAGGDVGYARGDVAALRDMRVYGNARVIALERAAWAILEGRAALHARVTRALLEGDLTDRDLRAIWRETPRF